MLASKKSRPDALAEVIDDFPMEVEDICSLTASDASNLLDLTEGTSLSGDGTDGLQELLSLGDGEELLKVLDGIPDIDDLLGEDEAEKLNRLDQEIGEEEIEQALGSTPKKEPWEEYLELEEDPDAEFGFDDQEDEDEY